MFLVQKRCGWIDISASWVCVCMCVHHLMCVLFNQWRLNGWLVMWQIGYLVPPWYFAQYLHELAAVYRDMVSSWQNCVCVFVVRVRHLVLMVEAWLRSWEVCYFNACPHRDWSKNACVCVRDRNFAHYIFYQQVFNIGIEEKPAQAVFLHLWPQRPRVRGFRNGPYQHRVISIQQLEEFKKNAINQWVRWQPNPLLSICWGLDLAQMVSGWFV